MMRTRYLTAGHGSMFFERGRWLPACWFRVQLRRGDLMARVNHQRTVIRK